MATSNPVPEWLTKSLSTSARIVNTDTPVKVKGKLSLGIDLGTSDVVSMVLDENNKPVAVCLEWADVVRDGVVLNFHGAMSIVRKQLAQLEAKLGVQFTEANTSFPPGTDPRISVNVLEAAGLEVSAVIDEPSAVANLLALDNAAVVDIGGGTTGIAVLSKGKVIYSGDEPTGGRHVTLTIAGSQDLSLEDAEALKLSKGKEVWPIVRPVFQKMADIVREHIKGHKVKSLYLSGGSCALPGVRELFEQEFPEHIVVLPDNPIFLTPFAIAAYRKK
ncbi:ethanolamine utilization protein EutJ [Neisseria sp. Ec49-e6-T10]|uniref:ethanolamine utilization protein EutJ n=1 Tax=Neisseria sp. Ec49-e6-T10 TaxID=3140744 RepID=UPI003EBF47A3